MPSGPVVPGHEGVDLGAWPLVGDALEGLGQPRCWIDVVHPACLQEGGDSGPRAAASVRSGEEAVLARDGLGPDGAFDDVGVELDQAVGQEAFEDVAPGDGVADGLGQLRFARDARQGLLPKSEQLGDDGPGDSLPRGGAGFWILAAHLSLELPEFGHALDRGGGDLTVPGCMEFIEAPSAMGPASSKARAIIAPVLADKLIVGNPSRWAVLLC